MTTEAHPLFLNETDEEPPEVGFIHIIRYDGPFSANRKIQIPKQFLGEELTDWEQITSQYGGGNYELVARDHANSRITRRVKVTLPGKSKPIIIDTEGEEIEDEEEETPQKGLIPPVTPGIDMTGIIGLVMHTSAQQMQMQMQMAEQRSRDQAEQTKLQIAQMQESNKMMMQMMMMQNQKPPDNSFIELAKIMLANSNKGGGSFSEILNAIKFGSDLKGNTDKQNDDTDWEATLGQFIKAFTSGQQQIDPRMIPQGMFPGMPQQQPQQPPVRRRVVDIHQGRVVPSTAVREESPPPMEPAGPPSENDKKAG